MRRWIIPLAMLSLSVAGAARADEPLVRRHVPGNSWIAASDPLGELIWPRTRDVPPPRGDVRQVRPNENGVHLTEGSVESLADWLNQFGEIQTGPGPKR